jgi:hypothetical protein
MTEEPYRRSVKMVLFCPENEPVVVQVLKIRKEGTQGKEREDDERFHNTCTTLSKHS